MRVSSNLSLRVLVAAVLLWLPATASALTLSGDCGNGCALDESFTHGNANEIVTAITALEGLGLVSAPAGELGGTWAATTLDDGITVANWNLETPNLAGKIDANNTPVSDDSCVDDQGRFWYDDTDTAFEFCDDNTGVPISIDAAAGVNPTDPTIHCVTKTIMAPDGTEPLIDVLGFPFAITLTRFRCNILPTSLAATIAIIVQECDAGHDNPCVDSVAVATACDNTSGVGWVTTFGGVAGASVDANDQVTIDLGTPSVSLAAGSLTLDICYSRQVVQ